MFSLPFLLNKQQYLECQFQFCLWFSPVSGVDPQAKNELLLLWEQGLQEKNYNENFAHTV